MKTRITALLLCLLLAMTFSCAALADYTEGQVVLVDEEENFSEDSAMFAGSDEKLVYPAVWTDGYHGKGLDFAGYKTHVRFDASLLGKANALTLSTWIFNRGPGLESDGTYRTGNGGTLVFGCSGGNGHFKIVADDGEYGDVVTFAYGLYNQDVYAVSETMLPVNEWAMVTATVNDTEMCLYLNGELIASAKPAVTPDALSIDLFRMGSSFWGPPSLNAIADDVSLWLRALSAEEVAALYAATKVAE